MKTLVMTSSFDAFSTDENGNKIPHSIENNNGLCDELNRIIKNRELMVIISGNPAKKHVESPAVITKKYFTLSGIEFKNVVYINDENKKDIEYYIRKADCINLFGGHLPTGNKFVNELNLKELLKDYNGVVIGSSGGAMNMASRVYCKPENESDFYDFKKELKGLDLTDINIIPHYNIIKDKTIFNKRIIEDIVIPDSEDFNMILLPDGSFVVTENNVTKIYGEAFVIENKKVKKINENNNVLIWRK